MFHNLICYDAHLFITGLGKKMNKDDNGIFVESKEKYISFNVKVNVKLVGLTNKNGKEAKKNIQLRFRCRFMPSSQDKLASNLCDKSGIQCDKCKGDIDLVNISGKNIALLGCKRCKAKKIKDLDERVLKKDLNHTSSYWGCDEKFCLMIQKGVYSYEYIDSWTKLTLKNAFYNKLNMKGVRDNECEASQQVLNTMEKKTLGCYHDAYLKTCFTIGRYI